MLRILHSLPRTHKLILLPIATMVTVLGAHKIIAALDTPNEGGEPLVQIQLPADFTAQASSEPADKPRQVTRQSSQDPTRVDVPLATLDAREIVDISRLFIAGNIPLKPQLDSTAMHIALQLPPKKEEQIGGTSYEDISADPMFLNGDGVELENELAAEADYVPEWETYTVQKGDTFAVMAERTLGLGFSEVMALLDEMPDKTVLTRWRVGSSFDFKLDESGDLLALRVMKNRRSGYLIERGSEKRSFDVAAFDKASKATQRLFAGTLSGSFAKSASATGLSNAEIAELSSLLSKKLDFRRKARRGDRFQVLVETDMIEGKPADSRILAAQYEGQKMSLTVVRNTEDDRFYTPEGHSLDPAFNRYPFNGKYRLSSSFNLRRKHPITGRISPHRGTDFAMRTGTTVLSPADGRVVKSTHQSLAGNYLVIQHDNGYKTRYMHLSKRLVSEGDRVTMGQKIALSGNTGRSTGPHLHYEVMVNNRHVDAMRVKLPDSKNLAGQALAAFKQNSKELLAKLETNDDATVVASRSTQRSRPDDGS
ncbi:murein DD-endopeptidase [Modicisalibacter ilicicola DSM 19980]|uniref:Murein DD-endopeptidase n=1 Tax=Modicisalibacter ilicicola DSM 19980 TaxID=1121942 RepID=A0A1M4ZR45_9GAMM|nr:peptidoglycan DD-metalloendopeptidase family protein [Halomonas ilicicola]SHF20026.1 murein DD-endopeptidase [Halomonas ilicicola DSM 19980]